MAEFYDYRDPALYQQHRAETQEELFGAPGRTHFRTGLDRFLDAISVGQYTVQGAIHGLVTDDSVIGSMGRGIMAANPFGQDYQEGEYSFSRNLGDMGWQPTSTFGKAAKGIVGMTGDILLDPLTYASLGVTGVIKGTGTKVAVGIGKKAGVETVEKFTKEMAEQAIKKSKGLSYIPKADEITDLMSRVNKLRGVAEETGRGIGFSTKDTIFAKKFFGDKSKTFVSEAKLRAFGDKTIAPYYNALTTKLRGNKLFSTKGTMIELAKDDPSAIYDFMKFAEQAGEEGVRYEDALKGLKDKYKDLADMDDETQQLITKLVEDKSLWKKIQETKPLSKTEEGEQAYQKMQDFIMKYGDSNPEMKKINKEILEDTIPKYNIGDELIARTPSGDIPVKIENYLGDYQGKRYYKVEGFNTGIPEDYFITKATQAEEISKASVDKNVEKIMNTIKSPTSREGINLSGNYETKLKELDNKFKQAVQQGDYKAMSDIGKEIEYYGSKSWKPKPQKKISNPFKETYDLNLGKLINQNDIDTLNAMGDLDRLATKRNMFEHIMKNDKALAHVLSDMIDGNLLSKYIPEKQIDKVFKAYVDNDIDKIVQMKHRFHPQYREVQNFLNIKYDKFKDLTQAQKKQYWDDMYRYLNDPKAFGIESATSVGRRTGLDIGGDVINRERYFSDMEEQRFKASRGSQAEYAGSIGKGQTFGKRKDISTVTEDIAKEYRKEEFMRYAKDRLEKKSKKIEQISKEADNIIEKYEPEDLEDFVGELSDMNKPYKLSNEDMLYDIVQDVPRIIAEGKDPAKYTAKVEQYRKALNSETEFENFMRTVWGNKKVDTLMKDNSSALYAIDKLDLYDKDIVNLAKQIRSDFKDVKSVEQRLGKLDNSVLEGYMAHILTPDAKDFIAKNMDEYLIDDLGISEARNNFAMKRKYKIGTELPDGYVLKKGTIEEVNEHMKKIIGGNKLFMDKISDIYLARMQKHYKLVYDTNMFHDMARKFGTPFKAEDDILKNNVLIYSTADMKKVLRDTNPDKAKLMRKYNISEEEIQKLGSNFREVDNIIGREMAKDGFIPVKQMPNVLIDKARQLQNVQMGEDINALLKAYDKFLHAYKVSVTALRPKFHANNIKGNLFQNYLNVGSKAFSPKLNKTAIEMLQNKSGKIILNGKEYTYENLMRNARKYEVVGKGFFGFDIKKEIAKEAETIGRKEKVLQKFGAKPIKKIERVGSSIEDQARLVNFLANLDNGRTFMQAKDNVDKFLFDYGDITKFEQKYMQRLFPFYTWTRKNVPLQLEQMASHPEKYLPVAKAIHEIEGLTDSENRIDKNKMPEWARDWVQLPGFVVNDKGDKEILMWSPNLPFEDINKLGALFSPKQAISEMVSTSTPLIRDPVSLATNYNYYLGQPIDSDKKVLDPSGKFEVSPQLAYMLYQIPQYAEPARSVRKEGVDKLITILDNAFGTGVKTLKQGKYEGGEQYAR